MFVAERGLGVTLNDRPLTPLGERRRPYRTAAPRSIQRGDAPGFALADTSRSCAIDYPQLLVGGVDVLAYRHQNPWDHLPGALMVTELGGRAAVHGGIDYRADTAGPLLLVASSPDLWQAADDALVTPEWLSAHPADPTG